MIKIFHISEKPDSHFFCNFGNLNISSRFGNILAPRAVISVDVVRFLFTAAVKFVISIILDEICRFV